jgi:hypothetical protein
VKQVVVQLVRGLARMQTPVMLTRSVLLCMSFACADLPPSIFEIDKKVFLSMMDWIWWSRVLLFLFLCSALPMVWVLIETDSTSVESSNVVASQLSIYHMGSDGASSFIYNSDTAPIESI